MRNVKKTSAVTALILAASLGLSACSKPDNPLEKVDSHDAGLFLAKASDAAQRELKLGAPHYGEAAAYGLCMQQTAPSKDCTALYAAMIAFAKTEPRFRALTVQELTDANAFKHIEDDYNAAVFAFLP